MSTVDTDQLNSFIQRVETLEAEKKEIADQIKEVLEEAKEAGLCPKTMQAMVKLRKRDAVQRQGDLFMFDLYVDALGLRAGPIGSDPLAELRKLTKDGTKVSVHANGETASLN